MEVVIALVLLFVAVAVLLGGCSRARRVGAGTITLPRANVREEDVRADLEALP